MKKFGIVTSVVLIFGLLGFIFVRYYSFIMATEVAGVVTGVERVDANTLVAPDDPKVARNLLFSFAIAIQTPKGEIFSASSEDRQWAVVNKGNCVVAKFYPYPFWNLENAGTWFNARLLKIQECPK